MPFFCDLFDVYDASKEADKDGFLNAPELVPYTQTLFYDEIKIHRPRLLWKTKLQATFYLSMERRCFRKTCCDGIGMERANKWSW